MYNKMLLEGCANENKIMKDGKCIDVLNLKQVPELISIAKGLGMKTAGVSKSKLIQSIRYREKNPCKPGKTSVKSRCIISDSLSNYSLVNIIAVAKGLGVETPYKYKKSVLIAKIKNVLECVKGEYVSGVTGKCTALPIAVDVASEMITNTLSTGPMYTEKQKPVTSKKAKKAKAMKKIEKAKYKTVIDDMPEGVSVKDKIAFWEKKIADNKAVKETMVDSLNKAIIKNPVVPGKLKEKSKKIISDIQTLTKLEDSLIKKQAQMTVGTAGIKDFIEEVSVKPESTEQDIEKIVEGMELQELNQIEQDKLSAKLEDMKDDIIDLIETFKDELVEQSPEVKESVAEIVGINVGENSGLSKQLIEGIAEDKPVVLPAAECTLSGQIWDDVLKACVDYIGDLDMSAMFDESSVDPDSSGDGGYDLWNESDFEQELDESEGEEESEEEEKSE